MITALLPLVTAACAAWVLHQRARLGFWLCAIAGSALVVAFSLLRAGSHGGGFGFEWADVLLVGAVMAASLGYIYGAQVTPALGAERVICWVCVMALPVTLPGTCCCGPSSRCAASAWVGFVYVGVFSMWIGLLRLVPRAGDGRRPARQPDPAAAALPLDPGGRAAARRTARRGHARLRRRRGGHRGRRQETVRSRARPVAVATPR